MSNASSRKHLLIGCIVAAVGFIAYSALTAEDRRSPADKMVDAVDELPNSLDRAARQLEDRTPAEKLKDAAKDATN